MNEIVQDFIGGQIITILFLVAAVLGWFLGRYLKH